MYNVDLSSSKGQYLQRISRHHSVTLGDHLGIACKLVRITDGVAHVRWSKFGLHAAPSLRLLYTCIDHIRNFSYCMPKKFFSPQTKALVASQSTVNIPLGKHVHTEP